MPSKSPAPAQNAAKVEDESSVNTSEHPDSVSTSTGSSLSSSTEDVFSQTVSLDPFQDLKDEHAQADQRPVGAVIAMQSLPDRHSAPQTPLRPPPRSPLSASTAGSPLQPAASAVDSHRAHTATKDVHGAAAASTTLARDAEERVVSARAAPLSNTSFSRSMGSFQRVPLSNSSFITDSVPTSRLAASRGDGNGTDNDLAIPAELDDETYIQQFHIHVIISLLAHDLLEVKPDDPALFTRNWLLQKLVEGDELITAHNELLNAPRRSRELHRHGSKSQRHGQRHSGRHETPLPASHPRKSSHGSGRTSDTHGESQHSRDGNASVSEPSTQDEQTEPTEHTEPSTATSTARQSFSLKASDEAAGTLGASGQRPSRPSPRTSRDRAALDEKPATRAAAVRASSSDTDASDDDDDEDSDDEWSNVKLPAAKTPATTTTTGSSGSSRRRAADNAEKAQGRSRHRQHKRSARGRRHSISSSSNGASINSDFRPSSAVPTTSEEKKAAVKAEDDTPHTAGARSTSQDLPLPVHALHHHKSTSQDDPAAETAPSTLPRAEDVAATSGSTNSYVDGGSHKRHDDDHSSRDDDVDDDDDDEECHAGRPRVLNNTEIFAFHHAAAASRRSASGTSNPSLTPEPLMMTKPPEPSSSADYAEAAAAASARSVKASSHASGVEKDVSASDGESSGRQPPDSPESTKARSHTMAPYALQEADAQSAEEDFGDFGMAQFVPVISLDPPPAVDVGAPVSSSPSSRVTSPAARSEGCPSVSMDIRSVHTNPPHSEADSTYGQSTPSLPSAAARELSNIPSAILASVAPTMASNVRLSHHPSGGSSAGAPPKPTSAARQSPTTRTEHVDPNGVAGHESPTATTATTENGDSQLFHVMPPPRLDNSGGGGFGSPSRNASFFSMPGAHTSAVAQRISLAGFASGSAGTHGGGAPVLASSVPVLRDILPATAAAGGPVPTSSSVGAHHAQSASAAPSVSLTPPPQPSAFTTPTVRVREAIEIGESGRAPSQLAGPSSASSSMGLAMEVGVRENSPNMVSFPVLNMTSGTASVIGQARSSSVGTGGAGGGEGPVEAVVIAAASVPLAAQVPVTSPSPGLGGAPLPDGSTGIGSYSTAGLPPSPQPQSPQQHARLEALLSQLSSGKCEAAIAFLEGLVDQTHESDVDDTVNGLEVTSASLKLPMALSPAVASALKAGSPSGATSPGLTHEDELTDMRRAQSVSVNVDALKASKSESVRAIVDDVLSHSVLMRLPHGTPSTDRLPSSGPSSTYTSLASQVAPTHAGETASGDQTWSAVPLQTSHSHTSSPSQELPVSAAGERMPRPSSAPHGADVVDASSEEEKRSSVAEMRARLHASDGERDQDEAGDADGAVSGTMRSVPDSAHRTRDEVSRKMADLVHQFDRGSDNNDDADNECADRAADEAAVVAEAEAQERAAQRRHSEAAENAKPLGQYQLPRASTADAFELGEMTLRHAILDLEYFREGRGTESRAMAHSVDNPLSVREASPDEPDGAASPLVDLAHVASGAGLSSGSAWAVSGTTAGDEGRSPITAADMEAGAVVLSPLQPSASHRAGEEASAPPTTTALEPSEAIHSGGGGGAVAVTDAEKDLVSACLSAPRTSALRPAQEPTFDNAEDPRDARAATPVQPGAPAGEGEKAAEGPQAKEDGGSGAATLPEPTPASPEELSFVENALARYDAFAILEETQTTHLAHTMARRELHKGDVIVREGEPALNVLMLVAQGTVTIAFRGVVRRTVRRGGFYGEVEVSYNLEHSRTTLTVTSPTAVLFTLSKAAYREAIVSGRPGSSTTFLPAVNTSPLLQKLPHEVKLRIAGALQPCSLRAGAVLQHAYAPVEWMYVILAGTVEEVATIPPGTKAPAGPLPETLSPTTAVRHSTRRRGAGNTPGSVARAWTSDTAGPTATAAATTAATVPAVTAAERIEAPHTGNGDDKSAAVAVASPLTPLTPGGAKRRHRVRRGGTDEPPPSPSTPRPRDGDSPPAEANATAPAPDCESHVVSTRHDDEENVVTITASTGALVGEVEFLFKCRGIFTVRAVTAVRTARISRLHLEVITSRATLNGLKYHLALSPSYNYFEYLAPEEVKVELRRLLLRGHMLSRTASAQGIGDGARRRTTGTRGTGQDQSSVDGMLGHLTRTATTTNVSLTRSHSMLIAADGDVWQQQQLRRRRHGNHHRRSGLQTVVDTGTGSFVAGSFAATNNTSFATTASLMRSRAGKGTSSHPAGRGTGTETNRHSSRRFLHQRIDAAGEVVFAGRKKMYRFPMLSFSTSGTILISVVADGTIIRWNNLAETATGIPFFDAVGTSIFDLITLSPTRTRLFTALEQAKNYAGRVPEYVAAGLDRQLVLPFRQRAGLYSVGLALSVIPSLSTDTAEVLLLVGREAKQRAASSYAADVAKWLEESMKPQLQYFLRSVHEVEMRDAPVTTQDVTRIRGHVEACLAMTDQFRHFSALNMENVHDNWHAVRVPTLVRRFAIDMTDLANQHGGSFFCNLDEVEPRTEIFLNVEQINVIIRALIADSYTHPREVMEHSTEADRSAADVVDEAAAVAVPSASKRVLPVRVELSVSVVEPMVPQNGSLYGTGSPTTGNPGGSPSSVATAPAATGHHAGPGGVTSFAGVSRSSSPNNNSFTGNSLGAATAMGSIGRANANNNTVDLSPTSLRRIRFELRDNAATIPFFHRGLDVAEAEEPLSTSPMSTPDLTNASFARRPQPRGAALAEAQQSVTEMGGLLYGFTRPDVDDNIVRIELPLLDVPGSATEAGDNTAAAVGEDGTTASWQADGGSGEVGRTYTVVVATNNQAQQNRLCQILWARQHAVVPVTSFKELLKKVSTENKSDIPDIVMVDPLLLDFSPSDYDAVHGTDPIDEVRDATVHVVLVVVSNDFSDWRVQKLLDRNAVVELPSYSSGALVHIAMQEAERMVVEMRAEVERIEVLRQAFKNASEGRHRIIRLIGKGTFGEVFEVEDVLTSGHMAMKRLQLRSDASADEVVQEILAMTTLQHENIIHYFFCEKESNTVLRLFMELATGGTLQNKIREQAGVGVPLGELVHHLTDICRGLAYIHSQNYVHCDLKTANLLLSARGRTKIGDFGTAKHLQPGQLLYALAGTAQYMAPEVLQADDTTGVGYDYKADIWSLGCVVLEMATGQPPFAHLDCARGVGIMKYLVELTDTPDLSPLFSGNPLVYDFVKSCLELDPNNRPTAQDLLRHEMLQGNVTSARAERIVKRAEMLYKLNKYAAVRDTAGEYPTGLDAESGSFGSTSYQSDSNATQDYNARGLDGDSEYDTPDNDEGAFFFSSSFSSEYDDEDDYDYDDESSTGDEEEDGESGQESQGHRAAADAVVSDAAAPQAPASQPPA